MNIKTDHKLSFNEHFAELRIRLIKVIISFTIAVFFSYYFSEETYFFLLKPLIHQNTHKIIYTSLTEAFFTYMKISLYQAIIIVFPIFAYQSYSFLSPGLYKHEKIMFMFFTILGSLLFLMGILFCYYIVIPNAWKFFLSFEYHKDFDISLEAKMNEYLSLSLHILIAFGLAFQLPLILMMFNKFGLITYETLKKRRRIAIVVMFFIAAIITPPDVISQIGLALPMILLYEIGLILCYIDNKRRQIYHA